MTVTSSRLSTGPTHSSGFSSPSTDGSCQFSSSGHLGLHRHDVEVHQVVEGQVKHILICASKEGEILLYALAWSTRYSEFPVGQDTDSSAAPARTARNRAERQCNQCTITWAVGTGEHPPHAALCRSVRTLHTPSTELWPDCSLTCSHTPPCPGPPAPAYLCTSGQQ